MNIEIHNDNRIITIHGFSGTAINKDYVGTAFKLSDKMWKQIKANGIKNKGMNIWVYEPNDYVFTGVELSETPITDTGMEQKTIHLPKYAYYKHIGPYTLIRQAGEQMSNELKKKGFEVVLPYIEIYGHWTGDENKAETELLMSLK